MDGELTSKEIEALEAWLATVRKLGDEPPFDEVIHQVERVMQGHLLTSASRDELLDWCDLFVAGSSFAKSLRSAAARLHGLLKGIAADGIVEDGEIEMLQEWLYDYEQFRNRWPISEVWQTLDRVTADGTIDIEERDELLRLCLSLRHEQSQQG